MATSHDSSYILFEMVPVLEGLVDLAKEKQQVLIRGDIPRLEQIVLEEQGLSGKLNLYERERVQLLACSGESMSGGADEELLRDAVRERATCLREVNEANQVLIKSSLNIIQHGLRLVMPQAGYDGKSPIGSLVFDRRS